MTSAIATLARRAQAHRLSSRVRRSPRPAGIVLVYHGLVERPEDVRPLLRSITVASFRSQLEHVRRRFEVVALDELHRTVGRPGRVAAAITFDDDLRSHATVAAPILRELGMPATFFLTGGSLDGPFRRWWHDLDALARRDWPAASRRLAAEWTWVTPEARPEDVALTIELLPARPRRDAERNLRAINDGPAGDPGLQADHVRELSAAGFGIGFHTREHHALTTLDEAELAAAMRDGLDELERAAAARSLAIAYPHCRADLRVAAAASRAGFELGCTCSGGAVGAQTPPLLIDRLDPADLAGDRGRFSLGLARALAAYASAA